jgi:hypothetical protein
MVVGAVDVSNIGKFKYRPGIYIDKFIQGNYRLGSSNSLDNHHRFPLRSCLAPGETAFL